MYLIDAANIVQNAVLVLPHMSPHTPFTRIPPHTHNQLQSSQLKLFRHVIHKISFEP